MKRCLLAPVVSIFSFAVALSPAFARETPDQAEIRSLYSRLSTAVKAKDIKTVSTLGTPDFTQRERPNGKVLNAQQAIAEMQKSMVAFKRINSVQFTPRTIAVKGRTAATTVDHSVSAVIIDKGKPIKFEAKGVTKDTLIRTAEGWKFKSITGISDESFIDGQKVPQAAAPTTAGPAPRGKALKARN